MSAPRDVRRGRHLRPEDPGGGETVDEALHRGARLLDRRGVENPLRNSRFLLAHALDADPGALVARLGERIPSAARRAFGKLLCSRGRRRPLQYLLGRWEFFGLELEVSPAALIPRPETERLVERILAELGAGKRRLADLGTGTGAVAIALATRRVDAMLVATDISVEALALAARNVRRHGLEERIELVEGDLLRALRGRVEEGSLDAVVANPPYVAEGEVATLSPEVRDHEPRVALVSGPSGLEAFERIACDAPEWLKPGGLLALEVGDGQAERVLGILAREGAWCEARTAADLAGTPRVVTARRA